MSIFCRLMIGFKGKRKKKKIERKKRDFEMGRMPNEDGTHGGKTLEGEEVSIEKGGGSPFWRDLVERGGLKGNQIN